MRKVKLSYLGALFVLSLLLAVIYYLVSTGMIIEVYQAFTTLNYYYLLVGVLLAFFFWLFGSLTTHVIIKHFYPNFKFRHSFEVIMIGQFFNGITPFASGGQPMQVLALRKNGVQASKGTSVLTIKFVVYQIVLVVISTFLVVLKYGDLRNQIDFLDLFVIIGFGFNLIIAIAILYLSIAKDNNIKAILGLGKILKRLGIVKDYDLYSIRVHNYLHDFHECSDILRGNTKILMMSAIYTTIQILSMLCVPYFVVRSFGIDVNLLAVVASAGFILMVASLVPIPGGSGGAEGGFILIMGIFLSSTQITTALILWRGITYYLGIVAGGLVYIVHILKHERDRSLNT